MNIAAVGESSRKNGSAALCLEAAGKENQAACIEAGGIPLPSPAYHGGIAGDRKPVEGSCILPSFGV